ncbi:hydrogenase maturation nickel metallochaperone HypA [Azoarcus taiwanensis]
MTEVGMHEMALAESVRGIVENAVRDRPGCKVKTVVLEIGTLASVEVDALRFCLEVVLRDSVADGANVEVENVPGQGWCIECAGNVPISSLFDACPDCGGYQVRPTSGTEMRVKELEVE